MLERAACQIIAQHVLEGLVVDVERECALLGLGFGFGVRVRVRVRVRIRVRVRVRVRARVGVESEVGLESGLWLACLSTTNRFSTLPTIPTWVRSNLVSALLRYLLPSSLPSYHCLLLTTTLLTNLLT